MKSNKHLSMLSKAGELKHLPAKGQAEDPCADLGNGLDRIGCEIRQKLDNK